MPISLPHFAESAVRAYKIAMTPPMMPVLLVARRRAAGGSDFAGGHVALRIPRLTRASPPQGDSGAVAEAARLLVTPQNPVIVADRAARTPAGCQALIELAETLQAPVIDQGGRMNFPSRHPLNHSSAARQLVADADVILGLELTDFWGTVNAFRDRLHRTSRSIAKPGAKLISITALRSGYERATTRTSSAIPEVDIAMAADAEATLPALIEACKRLITADRRTAFQERGKKLAEAHAARARARARRSRLRLGREPDQHGAADDGAVGADQERGLGARGRGGIMSDWPLRLWNFDKHYQSLGGSGGAGVGYGAPAAVGAALANKKHGRLSVTHPDRRRLDVCARRLVDGGASPDSAAGGHAQQPRLPPGSHAPAADGQPAQPRRSHARTSARRSRTRTSTSPRWRKGMGVHAEGPITNPNDLGPAIARALQVVKRGEPSLIDVVTQPR